MFALAASMPRAGGVSSRTVTEVCGDVPTWLCEQVYDATNGNEVLARLSNWLVDRPLSIVVILVIAWVAIRVLVRWVDRLVQRAIISRSPAAYWSHVTGLGSKPVGSSDDDGRAERDDRAAIRRAARAESVGGVLRSTLAAGVWTIALLLILGEFGIDLAPLIAGAGIAGVALGFGAQSLVRDCISGLFMLLEDQYGIGDTVDLGEATGSVEAVRLRTTVLRGVDGTVWHVPNGEVRRVGNKSQHWSTALIDIDVAYDADLHAVQEVLLVSAHEVCSRPEIAPNVLDEPKVLGVERLGADGITLRLTVMTAPGAQWAVQRALREAFKASFDAAGIEIPFPQRTVWLRNSES